MSKQYNKADHQAARLARLDAVRFLCLKGYSYKAIGYAFHRAGWWAMCQMGRIDNLPSKTVRLVAKLQRK